MTLFLPMCIVAVASALLLVQDPKPDDAAVKARLESAMKATGLNYEASASGLSLTVTWSHDADRSQRVFVGATPNRVGESITHSIYTTVWGDEQNPPDEATMLKVFTMSKKIGTFYLFKGSKGAWAIRFGAHFDATTLPETSKGSDALVTALKDMIRFVNQVGEETDRELNGTKDMK